MGGKEERGWELLFEEYKALRGEILSKMDKQYQIVGLGIGGITILLSFAFKEAYYSLFFVLPFLILACVLLLNAEIKAILNVSDYIRTVIEKAIFNENKNIIGWETWLYKHPEKVKIYKLFRLASLLIYGILYAMCVFGAIWYYSDNVLMRIGITIIYGVIGIFVFNLYNPYNFIRRSK